MDCVPHLMGHWVYTQCYTYHVLVPCILSAFLLLLSFYCGIQNTNRQFSVWQRNYLNCSSYYTYTLGVTMKEASEHRKETEPNHFPILDEMYLADGNAYRTMPYIQLKRQQQMFFGLLSPHHVCRCRPSSSMSPVNGASIYFYWNGLGIRQRKKEPGGGWRGG